MRNDKTKATELRREGKSYAQIKKELGIPLGTLSGWFKAEEWSKGVTQKGRNKGREGARVRMRELNKLREVRLKKAYEEAATEAQKELKSLRYDPLFVTGVMMYWQKGAKQVAGQLRFSSSDPEVLKVFLAFLVKICGVSVGKVKAAVFAHPGLDGQSAMRFWALSTGIPPAQFNKTMVVPGRYDAREFRYGSCTLILSSSYLKIKMLKWMNLLPKELMKR